MGHWIIRVGATNNNFFQYIYCTCVNFRSEGEKPSEVVDSGAVYDSHDLSYHPSRDSMIQYRTERHLDARYAPCHFKHSNVVYTVSAGRLSSATTKCWSPLKVPDHVPVI